MPLQPLFVGHSVPQDYTNTPHPTRLLLLEVCPVCQECPAPSAGAQPVCATSFHTHARSLELLPLGCFPGRDGVLFFSVLINQQSLRQLFSQLVNPRLFSTCSVSTGLSGRSCSQRHAWNRASPLGPLSPREHPAVSANRLYCHTWNGASST